MKLTPKISLVKANRFFNYIFNEKLLILCIAIQHFVVTKTKKHEFLKNPCAQHLAIVTRNGLFLVTMIWHTCYLNILLFWSENLY